MPLFLMWLAHHFVYEPRAESVSSCNRTPTQPSAPGIITYLEPRVPTACLVAASPRRAPQGSHRGRSRFCLVVCAPQQYSSCNIQFLTMATGRCLAVGVRLAVPSWFGRAIKLKWVRQAVPSQPWAERRPSGPEVHMIQSWTWHGRAWMSLSELVGVDPSTLFGVPFKYGPIGGTRRRGQKARP
jgi:hypothetical protein